MGVSDRALISSSFDSCHWTTLGFTLGDGRPLLCVIIFACAEVDAKMRMGIQPWCEIEGDLVKNMAENSHGVDKYFPYGPSCWVDGKEIPCYVRCSENGSITSEILTDILKHIDSFNIFDRREATPFLLLDGHGSRFGLDFLEYVNPPPQEEPVAPEDDHSWTVSIGTPYCTDKWQVADSKEQNGQHKNETKYQKQMVIQKKGSLAYP